MNRVKQKTRIAGCPHCFKYNRVPLDWYYYRCGHCGIRLEGVVPRKTGNPLRSQEKDQSNASD